MTKFRDWNAVSAWFRRGGPMKHKTTPRGGASNDSRDLIDQGIEELQEEKMRGYKGVKTMLDKNVYLEDNPDSPEDALRDCLSDHPMPITDEIQEWLRQLAEVIKAQE